MVIFSQLQFETKHFISEQFYEFVMYFLLHIADNFWIINTKYHGEIGIYKHLIIYVRNAYDVLVNVTCTTN